MSLLTPKMYDIFHHEGHEGTTCFSVLLRTLRVLRGHLVLSFSPQFSPWGRDDRAGIGIHSGFCEEWQNSVYSRLNKILREFKEQTRTRPSGEK